MEKTARNYAYDLLRIFCCLSIICLHVSGHLVWNSKYNLVVQGIVRPCLLTFMALSGYYVLSRPIKNIKEFYLKKLFFLVFPLIVYAALYQALPHFFESENIFGALNAINVTTILKTDIHGHFWFVYSLIGMYLVTPFLQKIVFSISNKQFILLLALIFYTVRLFPIMISYEIPALKVDKFPFDGTFVFFYLFGCFIKKNEKSFSKKVKIVVVVLGVLNIPFMAYMLTKPPFAATLCNLSLCTIIGVLFHFVFFSTLRLPRIFEKPVLFLSKRTFSIYLLHMLVFNMMTKHGVMSLTAENRMYMLGVKVILIFIICTVLCTLLDLLIINPIIKLYNKLVDCLLTFVSNKKAIKAQENE